MPSTLAKKAAGTYIEDSLLSLPNSLAWATQECRAGSLAPHVKRFCEQHSMMLDSAMVLVEQINNDCIHCRIPCRCYDHESSGTFDMEVKFVLDPKTGLCHPYRY